MRASHLAASVLMFLMFFAQCSAQQTSTSSAGRAESLIQLRSTDSEVRSRAFDRLRSDPVALRDPKVKAALVSLLDRENKEPIHGEEEDYAEYTSWLAGTVAKIVDWDDLRQVCVLANSVDLPDELADHAKVAIPCLLGRLKNGLNRYAPGPDISRGDVIAMLVQASGKGKSEIDADTTRTVREVVLSALQNHDADIKIPTIKALERFGGTDMIPALKVVAETDPDPLEHYAIRRWATEAIAAIHKREQTLN